MLYKLLFGEEELLELMKILEREDSENAKKFLGYIQDEKDFQDKKKILGGVYFDD